MPHCTHPLYATNRPWIRRIKRRTRWIKPITAGSVIKSFSKKYRCSPTNARADHCLERKPRSLGRRRRLTLATKRTSVPSVTRLSRARSHETPIWKCTLNTCAAVRYVATDNTTLIVHPQQRHTLYSRRRHTRLKSKRMTNRCQNYARRRCWSTTFLLSSQRLKLTSKVRRHLLNGLSLKPPTGKETFQASKNFVFYSEKSNSATYFFLAIGAVCANHRSCRGS